MNNIINQHKTGAKSLGMWLNMGDTQVTEIAATASFDWICLDLQHGLAEIGDLKNLLPIIERSGATPIVRVLSAEAAPIGRVLDLGAKGVIVPMIDTPEQAATAASACRYPPFGNRSCGPTRAMAYDPAYLSTANENVTCIIMIETAEGLANVEQIAALDGVDAVFVGPVDLSFSLTGGVSGLQTAEFAQALQRVVAAAAAASIPAGIFGITPAHAVQYLNSGFQFASISPDTNLLTAAIKDALEHVKSAV